MAVDTATFTASTPAVARPVQSERSPLTVPESRDSERFEMKGEMSFWDMLDVINPLQHIPIVNTIYRELTGDTIQPAAKVMGGILFGGVIGGMASLANAVVQEAQGKDINDQIVAGLGFGGESSTGTGTGTGTVAASAAGATAGAAVGAAAVAAQVAQAQSAPQGQPQIPPGAGPLQAAMAAGAAKGPSAAAAPGADGQPVRLTPDGGVPHPSRMPARDTPMASTTMAKHKAPSVAVPAGLTVPVSASAAPPAAHPPKTDGAAPVSPESLPDAMMRNLAKYEQSRKAAQAGVPAGAQPGAQQPGTQAGAQPAASAVDVTS